jgi:hypothetical protein
MVAVTTGPDDDERCTRDYDSHDWQWIDGSRVCVDCALIDLDGERIMHRVAEALAVPRSALRRRAASP